MNDTVWTFQRRLKRRISFNEFDQIRLREDRDNRKGFTHSVVLMGKYISASPAKQQVGLHPQCGTRGRLVLHLNNKRHFNHSVVLDIIHHSGAVGAVGASIRRTNLYLQNLSSDDSTLFTSVNTFTTRNLFMRDQILNL